jgi:SOS-response transcriptional repressor LexA
MELTAAWQAAPDDAAGVDPLSERPADEVPLFDLAVAAGRWVEIDGVAELTAPNQIETGRFRIRVRGDSMLPRWRDGDVVEFACVRFDADELLPGEDYYVQRSDETATFKRLERVEDESLVLLALNDLRYPEPIVVPTGLVVRMARAVLRIEAPPPGGRLSEVDNTARRD